jgi:hypothetical protein
MYFGKLRLNMRLIVVIFLSECKRVELRKMESTGAAGLEKTPRTGASTVNIPPVK